MNAPAAWRIAPAHPRIDPGVVHVWRIDITPRSPAAPLWNVLSADEQKRALRFFRIEHQHAFVLAHGCVRVILASYANVLPGSLQFSVGQYGKPALARDGARGSLEFNLSHSGDLALLAVAGQPVGIDVERWKYEMEHAEVAEHCFSDAERATLRSLGSEPDRVVAGFFAAWSRKEAYIKATGHGISRGLDHFDVTLAPGDPARLLADRVDEAALHRWDMYELPVGPGYSAALVAATPVSDIALFEARLEGNA